MSAARALMVALAAAALVAPGPGAPLAAPADSPPAREAPPTTPRVVEVTAKRFEFTPAVIRLRRGEPVILRVTSADVTHGFFQRTLRIDAELAPGKTVEVALTPTAAGRFRVICDHYCGPGHAAMHLDLLVE